MRKKALAVILPLIFLLAGFGVAEVKIRTENGKPLIDLDALLLSSDIGRSGNDSEKKEAEAKETASVPEEEKETEESKSAEKDEKAEQTVLKITVYGRYVYKDIASFLTYDKESDSVEGLDELLKEVKKADRVELIDNYAEAHAYRCVLEQIRKVKKAAYITETEKQ